MQLSSALVSGEVDALGLAPVAEHFMPQCARHAVACSSGVSICTFVLVAQVLLY